MSTKLRGTLVAEGRNPAFTGDEKDMEWEVRIEAISATNATLVPVLYINNKLVARFSYGNAEAVANALRDAIRRCL